MGLSARGAAKALGLTHPALLKAAKSGRITRELDGTYDVETVRRQLAENSNALKRRKPQIISAGDATGAGNYPGGATTSVNVPIDSGMVDGAFPEPSTGNSGTFAEAQRRHEWVKVQKEELELARRRAELAPIGEINAWVAGMVIRAREILIRIAPELKDRLAQLTDPHECEKLVDGEVRRALNELSEFRPAAHA